MLKMRLKRCGRKRLPIYRVVIMKAAARRDGKAIQELGFYNPLTKELDDNEKKVAYRLTTGEKKKKTVKNLFLKKKNKKKYSIILLSQLNLNLYS